MTAGKNYPDEPEFLHTAPGTQMIWEVKTRARPCWRCRIRVWLHMPKRHFGCPPFPVITNYVKLPPRGRWRFTHRNGQQFVTIDPVIAAELRADPDWSEQ